MFEPQHFVDLQENSGFGDPKSWLSGEDNLSPSRHPTQSSLAHSTAASGSNVDRLLYNDLVEIVPLVQSLIDRKSRSSFTKRASMIYTKTPSRESLSRKATDMKGKNAAQSIPIKKKKDQSENDRDMPVNNNEDGDSFSMYSSKALMTDKEKEELTELKVQLDELQRKLMEKDELLKSAEMSKDHLNDINAKLSELKHQNAEKESIVKSVQLQLSDAKIKLADKQAALEKTQWEAMTHNQKAEKLQEELESLREDFSSFMQIFEGLTKGESITHAEDYDIMPYHMDHLSYIDDVDDMEMQKTEEARQAYIDAVATAKEKQDEESLAVAANARLRLQSLIFRYKSAEDDGIRK